MNKMINMANCVAPPAEYAHHHWHWIDTEFGPIPSSWHPLDDFRVGIWDINGHMYEAISPRMLRECKYLGPAIPPTSSEV